MKQWVAKLVKSFGGIRHRAKVTHDFRYAKLVKPSEQKMLHSVGLYGIASRHRFLVVGRVEFATKTFVLL